MAGTFADGAAAAGTTAYRSRVGVAMVQVAFEIAGQTVESVGDTRKHQVRKSLATNCLQDPAIWSTKFSWAIQAIPAARDIAVTDEQLLQYVHDVFDSMAGSAS